MADVAEVEVVVTHGERATLRVGDGTRPHRRAVDRLTGECAWLVTNGVPPADLVTRNRRIAEAALRPWTPVFVHGDLHVSHVFVDRDEITGVIDWSEASQGDACYDLATLTLGHEEHLAELLDG